MAVVRSCWCIHPLNARGDVCLRKDEQLQSYTLSHDTFPHTSTLKHIRSGLATSTHLAALVKEHALHMMLFLRLAQAYSGKCPFCLTAGYTHDHQVTMCPQSNSTMYSNYRQFRSTISNSLLPLCSYCAFPLDVCYGSGKRLTQNGDTSTQFRLWDIYLQRDVINL